MALQTKSGKQSLMALLFLFFLVTLLLPEVALAGAEEGHHNLISSIGYSIVAAAILAWLGYLSKQPLILAYIAAGVIIGPKIGLGLVPGEEEITVISEIGLVLLLFMIGLEIDLKKLKESGKTLITSGVLQFLLCLVLGLGFIALLGYTMDSSRYDLAYLAACCALSSTTIVVKLLYSKFELDTLAGRITLGILVFQDLWVIILLGIQPNLANPDILQILFSFVKGAFLVGLSFMVSKFVLPHIFKTIAKVPELVLVASLGWCFLICGAAGFLGLSIEMGALIAGVAISTFPYNLDLIAKVISIRDFFITLFFVALGMQIPNPLQDLSILAMAAVLALFVMVSRFLTVYPILYALKNGHRVSLLTSLNLSNISEFSLVLTSIGYASGHIGPEILSTVIFVFVITSTLAPYIIKYNDPIQKSLSRLLIGLGLKDIGTAVDIVKQEQDKEVAMLGFFRIASSLTSEIASMDSDQITAMGNLKGKLVVVDFNPDVHAKLNKIGIKAIYGDISHMDTLHHANIHHAKVVLSTIPDNILVGTDNLTMIKNIKRVCPHAKIIVTAESLTRALSMYKEGADYVFLPRVLAAQHLIPVIRNFLSADADTAQKLKQDHIEWLKDHKDKEIIN